MELNSEKKGVIKGEDPFHILTPRRNLPWYKKLKYSIYRTWDGFLNATYWKLRNWNWKSPKPRGFDSRHGYSDVVELIPGQMFALFMRYYEEEHLKYKFIYTEEMLKEKLADPESRMESAEHIKRCLIFQKKIDWVANWIRTVYDPWDKQFSSWTVEKEEVYSKEMRKAMYIIVKYHGWMWT